MEAIRKEDITYCMYLPMQPKIGMVIFFTETINLTWFAMDMINAVQREVGIFPECLP